MPDANGRTIYPDLTLEQKREIVSIPIASSSLSDREKMYELARRYHVTRTSIRAWRRRIIAEINAARIKAGLEPATQE